MYGYIQPIKNELNAPEFALYRAHYCGMCKNLGRLFGQLPRFTTSYDITFLSVLLTSFNGEPLEYNRERCILNPFKKKPCVASNRLLERIANASIILAYFKAIDGIIDKDGYKYKLVKKALTKPYKKAMEAMPEVRTVVSYWYKRLRQRERERCNSIDKMSECFASMLKEVVAIVLRLPQQLQELGVKDGNEKLEMRNEKLLTDYNNAQCTMHNAQLLTYSNEQLTVNNEQLLTDSNAQCTMHNAQLLTNSNEQLTVNNEQLLTNSGGKLDSDMSVGADVPSRPQNATDGGGQLNSDMSVGACSARPQATDMFVNTYSLPSGRANSTAPTNTIDTQPTNANNLELNKDNNSPHSPHSSFASLNNKSTTPNSSLLTPNYNVKDFDQLQSLCYNIGKFVYLIDALDDIESDAKKKQANPFLFSKDVVRTKNEKGVLVKADFIAQNKDTLELIFALNINRVIECFNNISHCFLGSDVVGLLQNIIYNGLRARIDMILSGKKVKLMSN